MKLNDWAFLFSCCFVFDKYKTTRYLIACVRSAFLDSPSSGTLKDEYMKVENIY